MGYDEAIMTIAQKNYISWTPWAWRPGGGSGHNCQDINALGDSTKLAHPTNNEGADWLTLWGKYANEPN
jgi:hypothetical protein